MTGLWAAGQFALSEKLPSEVIAVLAPCERSQIAEIRMRVRPFRSLPKCRRTLSSWMVRSGEDRTR
jgi:hypothetical protein